MQAIFTQKDKRVVNWSTRKQFPSQSLGTAPTPQSGQPTIRVTYTKNIEWVEKRRDRENIFSWQTSMATHTSAPSFKYAPKNDTAKKKRLRE
jgi:hypothetical protein